MNQSTINPQETAKFAAQSTRWWDPEGPLKTLHDINPVRLEFIENITSLNHKKVLDLGCGGGILTEAMALKGANCTGIDAEQDLIDIAREHAKERNIDIDYQATAIEDFESDGFEIISCMEMLEHVDEPGVIIQHCERLLKPGGYLFLSTLNRSPKAYAQAILAAEYILRLLPRQTHDYNKFIKPAELASMIRHQGFELISLQGMNYNPFSHKACLTDNVSVNYLMACRKL